MSSRILTLPNILSFFRLALVPVFLVLLIGGADIAALIVLAVASATDFLDGYLARRWNQVTRLGQLLDPLADRLYLFAALLGLAARGLVPWWLVAVIIARDVLLIILGVVLASHRFGPLPVHQVGKVATFALFVGLPCIMLGTAFPATAVVAAPLGWAIALWGTLLYWWAGILYAIETARVVRLPTDPGALRAGEVGSDTLDR